jgi:hypothetical protein
MKAKERMCRPRTPSNALVRDQPSMRMALYDRTRNSLWDAQLWLSSEIPSSGWPNIPCCASSAAVVGSHTAFVHLYGGLIPTLLREPSEVRFTLRFEGGQVNGARLALTQYHARGIQWMIDPKMYPIHKSNASGEVIAPTRLLAESPNCWRLPGARGLL